MTFDANAEPVEGRYAVAQFTSGGNLLSGWNVTLNGVEADAASIDNGKYTVTVRKDGTGIWLKVSEAKGTIIFVR